MYIPISSNTLDISKGVLTCFKNVPQPWISNIKDLAVQLVTRAINYET